MNDYARIAQVIRYLDQCHHEQPDLATLADLVGLSPFHFHRLFRGWTGVTPKAFLQCLTMETARRALREGVSVLDAALDAGLTGPGRLHDLCVKLEGASPGEIKSGGRTLTLDHGFADSPFGRCLLASGPRGLCHLSFVEDEGGEVAALEHLRRAWPHAGLRRQDTLARDLLLRVFEGGGGSGTERAPLVAWVRGTSFQLRVWRALLALPPGHLISYADLARAAGRPGAARAVGSAMAANPIALLIPCHRVIRSTGVIGDYRWGHGRKRALIAWEHARLEAPPEG